MINGDAGCSFHVAYVGWVRPLLAIFGLGPGRTNVEITGDRLRVRMGWAFRAEVPLSSVVAAYQRPNPWWNVGLGLRTNLLGAWAVSGSWSNIVQVDVEPAVVGHVFWGFPVGIHHLLLSLDDPNGFLATVNRR